MGKLGRNKLLRTDTKSYFYASVLDELRELSVHKYFVHNCSRDKMRAGYL